MSVNGLIGHVTCTYVTATIIILCIFLNKAYVEGLQRTCSDPLILFIIIMHFLQPYLAMYVIYRIPYYVEYYIREHACMGYTLMVENAGHVLFKIVNIYE